MIFDASSKQIAIRRLAEDAFDFAGSVPNSQIATWLADQGTVRALE